MAAGDGRLTAAELDERVEAALTARTYRDLERLTADLPTAPGWPGAPGQEAKDVVRLDRRGANARLDGHWAVPRRMEIRAVGCTVTLDFTVTGLFPGVSAAAAKERTGWDLAVAPDPEIIAAPGPAELQALRNLHCGTAHPPREHH